MSKAFTAASLGLVMDDYAHGRNVTSLPNGLPTFDWDTKLRDLLPDDWKLMDQSASEHARVRDILSHMSGLPRCARFHNLRKVFVDMHTTQGMIWHILGSIAPLTLFAECGTFDLHMRYGKSGTTTISYV
jgi:hypothetical protein